MSRVMLFVLPLIAAACAATVMVRRFRRSRRRYGVYGAADGRLYEQATSIEEARQVVVSLRQSDQDSGWQEWGQDYRIVEPPQERAA
jgi:hypothetical protein